MYVEEKVHSDDLLKRKDRGCAYDADINFSVFVIVEYLARSFSTKDAMGCLVLLWNLSHVSLRS